MALLFSASWMHGQTLIKPDVVWTAGGSVAIDSISPDGTEFADHSAIWTRTGQKRFTLTEYNGGNLTYGNPVAFSPSGLDLVGVVGLSSGNALGVWSRATGTLTRVIGVDRLAVRNGPMLSADGARLMVGLAKQDNTQPRVRLLEYSTGRVITNFVAMDYGQYDQYAFSPDGTLLAVGGPSTVTLARAADGVALQVLPAPYANSVRFSPDSRRLALSFWDGATNRVRVHRVSDGATELDVAVPLVVVPIDFVSDGTRLVVPDLDPESGGIVVKVWSIPEGRVLQTFTGHNDDPTLGVVLLRAVPAGDRVLSVDSNHRVMVWSATTGALQASSSSPNGRVVLSPDGKEFAVTTLPAPTWGSGTVSTTFRSTEDGSITSDIQAAHHGWVQSMAFSPDSRYLATGCSGGGKGIPWGQGYLEHNFRDRTNDSRVQIWRVADGHKTAELIGANAAVAAVAISSAGVVAGGSADGLLHFWSLETGEHLNAVSVGARIIWSLSFSPDGSLLVIDEMHTPDSSRYWPAAEYRPGMILADTKFEFGTDAAGNLNIAAPAGVSRTYDTTQPSATVITPSTTGPTNASSVSFAISSISSAVASSRLMARSPMA